MFKMLIVEEKDPIIKVIKDALQNEFSPDIKIATSGLDAEASIKENEFSLVIVRNILSEGEDDAAKKILNSLYDKSEKCVVIVLGKVDIGGFEYQSLPERFLISDLILKIKKSLDFSKEDLTQIRLPDYYPIPIKNFYLMNSVLCDIFIRIIRKESDDQYVLRIKDGDEFEKDAIRKYEKKGVKEFFIKKELRHLFLDDLYGQTVAKLNAKETSMENLVETTGDCFEVTQDLLVKMGVNEYSYKLGEATIESMMGTITIYDDKLGSLVKGILDNKGSYSYRHSYLISVFASGIVPKLDLGDDQLLLNLEKMTFVAFYHDILLPNDKLVSINSKNKLYNSKLTDEEKELVLNHANQISTLVQELPKAPPDVDVIIRQHHGMPNGHGFSERPKASLSPLAMVFIVVERFVDGFLHFKEGDSLKALLDEIESEFNIPSYRKIVDALKSSIIANFK